MEIEQIKNRILSEDEPKERLTMVRRKSLDFIEYSLIDCIENNIEGDFIETGVWKGGCVILAYNIIKKLKSNKKVYAYDSFDGLPKPDKDKYPIDGEDNHWRINELKIPLDVVKSNFKLFGDIDDSLIFVEGFFRNTIPINNIDKLCIMRLDGDMYESTIEVLEHLYPKLSINGYVIIDDYGIHWGAYFAVLDYREKYNITNEIIIIDDAGNGNKTAYWKK